MALLIFIAVNIVKPALITLTTATTITATIIIISGTTK